MTLKIISDVRLPTQYGDFRLAAFEGFADGREHVALVYGDVRGQAGVFARIHSECLTGDVFKSLRCDCGQQLDMAMQKIAAAGCGVILYLRQEGRGIGLNNKLRAYALQDHGMDTVEANEALGFAADARDYASAVAMLKALDVPSVRLMTNNPRKVSALKDADIAVERVPLLVCAGVDNEKYLETKSEKLDHLIPPALRAVS